MASDLTEKILPFTGVLAEPLKFGEGHRRIANEGHRSRGGAQSDVVERRGGGRGILGMDG
jgi:hypothetical protein